MRLRWCGSGRWCGPMLLVALSSVLAMGNVGCTGAKDVTAPARPVSRPPVAPPAQPTSQWGPFVTYPTPAPAPAADAGPPIDKEYCKNLHDLRAAEKIVAEWIANPVKEKPAEISKCSSFSQISKSPFAWWRDRDGTMFRLDKKWAASMGTDWSGRGCCGPGGAAALLVPGGVYIADGLKRQYPPCELRAASHSLLIAPPWENLDREKIPRRDRSAETVTLAYGRQFVIGSTTPKYLLHNSCDVKIEGNKVDIKIKACIGSRFYLRHNTKRPSPGYGGSGLSSPRYAGGRIIRQFEGECYLGQLREGTYAVRLNNSDFIFVLRIPGNYPMNYPLRARYYVIKQRWLARTGGKRFTRKQLPKYHAWLRAREAHKRAQDARWAACVAAGFAPDGGT